MAELDEWWISKPTVPIDRLVDVGDEDFHEFIEYPPKLTPQEIGQITLSEADDQ